MDSERWMAANPVERPLPVTISTSDPHAFRAPLVVGAVPLARSWVQEEFRLGFASA
jgi:hypothetical protein